MLARLKNSLLNLEPLVQYTKRLAVELMTRRKCEKFRTTMDQTLKELSPACLVLKNR